MLEQAVLDVYTKFKLNFYRRVFHRFAQREATLTTVETFCMEVIRALGRPTINEFAQFVQISQANAAYKVNNLVKKGYVKKVQSETDRREYYLAPTDKFTAYYGLNTEYIKTVSQRINERFAPEEVERLEEALRIICDELMPEVPTYAKSTEE